MALNTCPERMRTGLGKRLDVRVQAVSLLTLISVDKCLKGSNVSLKLFAAFLVIHLLRRNIRNRLIKVLCFSV